MDKFFTKKESETIYSLLQSTDSENIKLAMDLISTHPRFKTIQKRIIMRYRQEWVKSYYDITPKQSFGLYYKIHQDFITQNKVDKRPYFYRAIAKFIKKHTFNSK